MKTIPNFSKYKINTKGEIFSYQRGWEGKKLITPYNKAYGYYSLSIVNDEGEKVHCLVHRLVAITYLPNPENKPEVNHIDGNKLNNFVDNLEWVTRSENNKHAFSLGLNDSKGVKNGRSKLSEDDVLSIYQLLLEGSRACDVAKDFNISKSVVMGIKTKRSWSHITKSLPDISIKAKKKQLSAETVKWVCQLLQEGFGTMEIVRQATNPLVDEYKVHDIKRRRSFKHISKDYNF